MIATGVAANQTPAEATKDLSGFSNMRGRVGQKFAVTSDVLSENEVP